MGIGDLGFVVGAHSPSPKPQTPLPTPKSPIPILMEKFYFLLIKEIVIK